MKKYTNFDFQGKREDQVKFSYDASFIAFLGLLVCIGYLLVSNLF